MGRTPDTERTRRQQDEVLAAFASTGNIVSSCAAAGIHPPRHYAWVKDSPDYAARFAEVQQAVRAAGILVRKPHSRGYKVGGRRAEIRKEKQEAVLKALAQCGIIQQAAREAQISAATFYQWQKDEPGFAGRV